MHRTGARGGDAEDAVLRLVQEHAVDLLRFARRFSLCADDAHDAYQRGIEILVRRMRTEPPEQPLSWLRTVIRHEALTVRAQRQDLVGREAVDLDRHEGRQSEDPAERTVGFERLRHTAEALQRLKPQELTALVLRAEGLSYKEICTRMSWTYTKTNRAVTEGRRALLQRLGAIESGAECARWLPLLSALADGEASSRQLADLRPHLRACPGCRATLRRFHGAPGEVAALVPVVLVPLAGGTGGTLSRPLETVVHALLERTTFAAMRVQGAFEALPGAKLAAVAASTVAIAGGSAAIEHAAHGSSRPRPTAQALRTAAAGSASGLVVTPASLPWSRGSHPFGAAGSDAARRGGLPAGDGEFALEPDPPTAAHAESAAPRLAHADAAAQFAPPTSPAPPTSSATAASAASSAPASSQRSPPAEFAGP